jgi:hypothetical protein
MNSGFLLVHHLATQPKEYHNAGVLIGMAMLSARKFALEGSC